MAGRGDHAQGVKDNRRGQARQALCAAYAREHGYTGAKHVGQYPGERWRSDLTGVGPRVIEVTVEPFERIAAKLRQAELAAIDGGLAEFAVWKHIGRGANESGSVADSAMILRARTYWAMVAELDELRAFTSSPAAQAELERFRQARRSAQPASLAGALKASLGARA